jgi:hypothetical protein
MQRWTRTNDSWDIEYSVRADFADATICLDESGSRETPHAGRSDRAKSSDREKPARYCDRDL